MQTLCKKIMRILDHLDFVKFYAHTRWKAFYKNHVRSENILVESMDHPKLIIMHEFMHELNTISFGLMPSWRRFVWNFVANSLVLFEKKGKEWFVTDEWVDELTEWIAVREIIKFPIRWPNNWLTIFLRNIPF